MLKLFGLLRESAKTMHGACGEQAPPSAASFSNDTIIRTTIGVTRDGIARLSVLQIRAHLASVLRISNYRPSAKAFPSTTFKSAC